MKYLYRLVIFVALCAVAFAGRAETPEELSAWVGRPLTSNELALAEFEAPRRGRNSEHVLVCSGYGVIQSATTNTIVPQLAVDQVYGAGVVSNVPLHNFTLTCEQIPDSTNSVFVLSANYNLSPKPPTRKRYTCADDVMQWLGITGQYGVSITNILTVTEYQKLMSPE